jgi:hypothetical protein
MAAAGPETVKVIVRCRPMNRRENDLKCVVSIFSFFNIDLFFTFIIQLQIVYLHSLLPLSESPTQNKDKKITKYKKVMFSLNVFNIFYLLLSSIFCFFQDRFSLHNL